MTGGTHCVEGLACCSIAGRLGRGLRERRMAAQPRLKSGLFLHHDPATHDKVPGAAQFVAEEVEFPGPSGGEPDIRDQAGHQVHLGPELRYREVVQDVYRAEQRLDRPADGEMQLRARYQDVVLSVGIVGIHAKRVFIADVLGIDGAHHAVLPGEAKAPAPLLAYGLEYRRVWRDLDEFRPYEQAGGQHGGDAHRGQSDEPRLELLVLGFVLRPLALPVTVADHGIGHEQIDGDEDKPRDPERDADRVVHRSPVGGDRREIPRAQEVKQDRANDQYNQYDCYDHSGGPG